VSLDFADCLLPGLPIEVQAWSVELRSRDPIEGRVDPDGGIAFGEPPLELRADLTLDAGVLGSFDVAVAEVCAAGITGRWDGELLSLKLQGGVRISVEGDQPPGVKSLVLDLAFDSTDLVLGGLTIEPAGLDGAAAGDGGGASR
jgi:hypothetical protein